jgi:hypothetical protein
MKICAVWLPVVRRLDVNLCCMNNRTMTLRLTVSWFTPWKCEIGLNSIQQIRILVAGTRRPNYKDQPVNVVRKIVDFSKETCQRKTISFCEQNAVFA